MIRDGSHGSTYVQALYGNPKLWDAWPEIPPLQSAHGDLGDVPAQAP